MIKGTLLSNRTEKRNSLCIETIKKISTPQNIIKKSIEKYNDFALRHGVHPINVFWETCMFSLSASQILKTDFHLQSCNSHLITQLTWENTLARNEVEAIQQQPKRKRVSKLTQMQKKIDELSQIITDLRAKNLDV